MKEEGRCGFLIKQIHDELEKNANNCLRKDDLTMMQVAVLMELDEAEEKQMELKGIERCFHVAQSTAAGIVKRLEEKGLVEAFTSAQDKRVKMVRVTPRGLACCRKSEVNMQKTEALLTGALTQKERETLVCLLQKVRDSF